MLDKRRDMVTRSLDLIHDSIRMQLSRESLSRDIGLESSLAEAEDTIGTCEYPAGE